MQNDPPDFLCVDASGKRIGVELQQWVNEKQMAASKARCRLEQSYLRVIRSTDEPPPKNIGLIWLFVKDNVQLHARSAKVFREELYKFIADIDAAWVLNAAWHDPQGYEFRHFTDYPSLARHLDGLDVYSRARFSSSLGAEWITFPAHGGAYSPEWMRDALLDNVKRKILRYSAPPQQTQVGAAPA